MVRGFASQTSSVFKGVLGAELIGAGARGAIDGVRALGGVLRESVGEARESQKVGATTAQVIKATGGAAKVSAGQVGDLATQLSNKAGVDDEAIQSGANLLLTFKNVRNEAGKGGAVFDRATAAAVDLSATGFGSISGSSKMLGKALNDPVKGISALSRAGVTFTAQQKEQIAALVKTGDVLGAQKIILGEVEAQVGGVAAAQATAGEKAKVMADNLKEQLGTALLPTLDRLAGFFTTTLGPAISSGITKVGPALAVLGTTLSGVTDLLFNGKYTGLGFLEPIGAQAISVGFALRSAFFALPSVFAAIGAVAGPAFAFIVAGVQQLAPAVLGIATTVGPALLAVVEQIRGLALTVLPVIIGIAAAAAPLIAGLVAQVGGVITALLPGIVGLVTTVGGVITALLPGIAGVVSAVVSVISTVVPIVLQVFGAIATAIQANLPALTSAFQSIKSTVVSVVSIITSVWSTLGPIILPIITAVFGTVVQVISGALKIVAGLFKVISSALKGDWRGAFAGMLETAAGVTQIIVGLVRGFVGVLRGSWGNVVGDITGAWGRVKSATSSAWASVVSTVSGLVSRLASTIGTKLNQAKTVVVGVWNSIKSTASTAWAGIVSVVTGGTSAVLATVRSIPGQVASALSGLGGLLVGSGRAMIQGLADGIRAGISSAIGAARSAVEAIRGFFPSSPAKKGPFSGKGWTLYSGRSIGEALGRGMLDTRREVTRSANSLADAAALRTAVTGTRPVAASGQRVTSRVAAAAGSSAFSALDMDTLAAAVERGAYQGGRDAIAGHLKALDKRGMGVLVAAGNDFNRTRGGRA